MQWASLGQQSQSKGQNIHAWDNAKLIAILHRITTWNVIQSTLLQTLVKSSHLAFAWKLSNCFFMDVPLCLLVGSWCFHDSNVQQQTLLMLLFKRDALKPKIIGCLCCLANNTTGHCYWRNMKFSFYFLLSSVLLVYMKQFIFWLACVAALVAMVPWKEQNKKTVLVSFMKYFLQGTEALDNLDIIFAFIWVSLLP